MFESKELLRRIDYLEDEKGKLWERIIKLESEVKENASSHEKDARQSSKKAAEYKNRAEERRDAIEELHNQSNTLLNNLTTTLTESNKIKDSINTDQSEIKSTIDTLTKSSSILETKINKIEEILIQYPNLDNDIDTLTTQLETTQESSAKIAALLKGVSEKKKEIDEIFFEIAGYDEENEDTGQLERIEGLKDKLKVQYEGLSQNLKDLKTDFGQLLTDKNKETEDAISEWNDKYDALIKKIETLLPNALTAGLSSAYSSKKEKELLIYNKLKVQFNWGILGMVMISLLSVLISVYFIQTGTPFKEVIYILPNIAAAVIPLYIPVLWFTFSANKKVNLSKRLIEEYTHKEVISKTFEGLSTQIENIKESEISKELKLKLLFNLLEMSTENPGKLISDYKNTDHPVLEVLKQQSKLEQALAKAKDFPGVNKLNELVVNSKMKQLNKKKEEIEKIVQSVNKVIE